MIVLVTGWRDWEDEAYIYRILDKERKIYASELEWNLLIHGGARGVDTIAGEWAHTRGIHTAKVEALWDYYKKPAGPIRNSMMLYLQPSLVIAFHPDLSGSRGTADMIKKAKSKHIPVEIYNGRPANKTEEKSK